MKKINKKDQNECGTAAANLGTNFSFNGKCSIAHVRTIAARKLKKNIHQWNDS